MTWQETLTTTVVLLGLFLLAYSAIRKQGIGDTIREMREAFSDKTESLRDNELRYAN